MPQLIAFAYALPRMLAMFSVLPMFHRQALPGLLRMGVAGALGLMLVPQLLEPAALDRGLFEILAVVIKEGLIGFAVGMLFALPLWAFEAMGAIIDNQRGASIAETINPLTGHDTSPLGELLSQAFVVYINVTGGFALMLAAMYDSFLLWPVFEFWPRLSDTTPAFLLGQFDRMVRIAVLFGSPVIIAMFLSELGLALVSRFAPQLQVFFLAMPIKSGIAMFMLAIYAKLIFHYSDPLWDDIGNETLRALSSIFRAGGR